VAEPGRCATWLDESAEGGDRQELEKTSPLTPRAARVTVSSRFERERRAIRDALRMFQAVMSAARALRPSPLRWPARGHGLWSTQGAKATTTDRPRRRWPARYEALDSASLAVVSAIPD